MMAGPPSTGPPLPDFPPRIRAEPHKCEFLPFGSHDAEPQGKGVLVLAQTMTSWRHSLWVFCRSVDSGLDRFARRCR